MTRLCLKGQLMANTMSPPSALQSSSPTGLTFGTPIHFGVDPSVELSIGLVLVGGAKCVPQVPVSQPCKKNTENVGVHGALLKKISRFLDMVAKGITVWIHDLKVWEL